MIIGKAISPFALRKKTNGGGGGNDPDAQLFITATGISGTNATATNKLVIDLKAANIWTKMKSIYPFVGNTASSQKYNLKDARDLDAAYRLVFSGGGTHSANGYQPGGVNGFANTFLTPSLVTTLNSIHLSYYSRTNNSLSSVEIGCWDGAGFHYTFLRARTAGNSYSILQATNTSTYANFADANSLGFYNSSRTALNLTKIYKNGIVKASDGTISTGQPSASIYISASNGNTLNYSNRQCAFASIGDGLTDAEALAYYNAVNAFQLSLARNV